MRLFTYAAILIVECAAMLTAQDLPVVHIGGKPASWGGLHLEPVVEGRYEIRVSINKPGGYKYCYVHMDGEFHADKNKSYIVDVTPPYEIVSYGCDSDVDQTYWYIREAESSVQEESIGQDLLVRPNPVGETMHLDFSSRNRQRTAQIFSVTGQRIRAVDVPAGTSSMTVYLHGLGAGLYWLVMESVHERFLVAR